MLETLVTERLRLRPFTLADEKPLAAMVGDCNVMQHYGGGAIIADEDFRSLFRYHLNCREYDYWAWAITGKTDGRFIGSLTAGFTNFEGANWLEPAWILARSEWGHGFATEAATAFLNHALNTIRCERVLVTTGNSNQRSARVIEKAGFRFWKEAEVRQGRWAKIFTLPISDAMAAGSSSKRILIF
jgi:RimJ/RimL family protein N-acetyltransferase